MSTRNAPRKRKTKAVTIKKVASRANVSVATVSRVLNRNGAVKPHLRRAVEHAIQDLKYEYKAPQPNGRRDGPYRIGLVVPTILNPFHALLTRGICSAALLHHAELVLLDSGDDQETERQQLARAAELQGIIYIPFAPALDPVITQLLEARFPLVFLDRVLDREDACTVASDNAEGAYQAVTYLLDLGHRDIAYIAGPPHFSTSVTRFEGYARGLREHGVALREELVFPGDTSFETAYAEMQRFLRSGQRCSAVFASNDMMAFGAWQAAEEAGLRVPGDLSVIGYDELPFSAYRSLTTIAQPSYEMGRNALTLLVDLIEGRCAPPQRIVLRDSLIIRRSCRKVS